MRQADLFVLPSRIADDGDRDGLPNVLMEAASQKLPILSTSVSRKQARIDTTGGRPVLIDLGSANGTRVNGEAVDRESAETCVTHSA